MCDKENIALLRVRYEEMLFDYQASASDPARRLRIRDKLAGMSRAFSILHPELTPLGRDE